MTRYHRPYDYGSSYNPVHLEYATVWKNKALIKQPKILQINLVKGSVIQAWNQRCFIIPQSSNTRLPLCIRAGLMRNSYLCKQQHYPYLFKTSPSTETIKRWEYLESLGRANLLTPARREHRLMLTDHWGDSGLSALPVSSSCSCPASLRHIHTAVKSTQKMSSHWSISFLPSVSF